VSTFNDFPGLLEADRRAGKAVEVLKSAIDHLHPPRNGEGWAEIALRLRGAAVLAHSAGLELAVVSGWNEAAHEAADSGMLDERSEGNG
jgi:hypothetical protein